MVSGCASIRSLSRCRTRFSRICASAFDARAGRIRRRGSRGRRASIWTTFVACSSTGPTGSTGGARSGGSTASSTVWPTWTVCASTSSTIAQPTAGSPLVLTHGWPSTFVELLSLVERLGDRFDLVVPSLPGYAFSQRPPRAGVDRAFVARLWHRLMQGLGYERYGAHGGDFGAGVATYMALLAARPDDRHPPQHTGDVAVHGTGSAAAVA